MSEQARSDARTFWRRVLNPYICDDDGRFVQPVRGWRTQYPFVGSYMTYGVGNRIGLAVWSRRRSEVGLWRVIWEAIVIYILLAVFSALMPIGTSWLAKAAVSQATPLSASYLVTRVLAMCIMMLLLVCIVIPLMHLATVRLWGATTARELVSRRHCASCGYTLDNLEVDASGVAKCSECGAAWKLLPTP